MKFALISFRLLFIAVLLFGCKQTKNEIKASEPEQEKSTPATPDKKEEIDTHLEPKIPPIEQKSDRSIKKKKPKNALDTLRPKTA